MLAKLKTFSLVGIEALPVEVEVDVSPSGFPSKFLSACRRPPSKRARIGWSGRW